MPQAFENSDVTFPANEKKHRPYGNWHQLSIEEAVTRLGSNASTGLSTSEVKVRIGKCGENQISDSEQRTWPRILSTQLQSSLVLLLAVAAVISFFLGEGTDAIAIVAIILLNTALGFWQDFSAEKSLSELKKLSVPDVNVLRNGSMVSAVSSQIVPGDIVSLQAGFFVPADCRLIEQVDLAIDESTLTGESLPVSKSTTTISDPDTVLGDRVNSVFMGTMVARGRGLAVVTATGMSTELGKVAGSLQAVEVEQTPLQIKLGQLGRALAFLAILVVAIIFLAGLVSGMELNLMLMTAISLSVAIVPEGLPAVATVALAVGARKMFKRHALIRQLPAVETLGSVSVICSDKTGTLTQNRMTVTVLNTVNQQFTVDDKLEVGDELSPMLAAGCLCNNAKIQFGQGNTIVAVGEPTEKALVEVAAKLGLDQVDLENKFPRINEIAFDSDRKRMTTLHRLTEEGNEFLGGDQLTTTENAKQSSQQVAFCKGAVEQLLSISSWIRVGETQIPLEESWIERIRFLCDELASQGARVLAVGFRRVPAGTPVNELETDVTFLGLFGLTDPPRPQAKSAIELCRRAGIRPIMITGDHPLTALSIAKKIGMKSCGKVVTGQELAGMTAEELGELVKDTSVFARVAPADKLNIVEALEKNNEVVAMTGDGVNDAPALKQANIGVAMGITGTDVSKQAANMVLLDDDFSTIVAAVEQGRTVYDNIRKFVKYAMSGNVGEVFVMTAGVLFGFPLPLLPLQILWVNLVTDGLPGLALAVEPCEKTTMHRPPLSLDEPILNLRMLWDLLWIGSWICLASLGMAAVFWSESKGVEHWRTIVFTVLTLTQMANAFACRSESTLLFSKRLFENHWLLAAVGSTFLLQLLVIYWPPMQSVFQTKPLSLLEFISCLAISYLVFAMIELRKLFTSNSAT